VFARIRIFLQQMTHTPKKNRKTQISIDPVSKRFNPNDRLKIRATIIGTIENDLIDFVWKCTSENCPDIYNSKYFHLSSQASTIGAFQKIETTLVLNSLSITQKDRQTSRKYCDSNYQPVFQYGVQYEFTIFAIHKFLFLYFWKINLYLFVTEN
jgi:hypothetical protein